MANPENMKALLEWFCTFYEKKLNLVQYAVWCEVFQDYDEANIKQAMQQCIAKEDSNFFPPIINVRKYLKQPFNP